MIDEVFAELELNFDNTISGLQKELAKIRTGRANVAMLNGVMVEYYGSMTPLNQVATLRVSDPRLITVQPFENRIIGDIERAIANSDLGFNPSNDGQLIRVPVPALSGERREELVKIAKRHGEDHKISLRNHRRDANDMVKALQKEGDISEDAEHKAYDKINALTDGFTKKVDELLAAKEEQILEV